MNSATHPQAYAFLNRMCNGNNVNQEVLKMWKEKGTAGKNKLLSLFVNRCYDRGADTHTNRSRLEALVTYRQKSSEWKKTLAGYSWLTEGDMKGKPYEWNDKKVAGAVQYCLKRKLWKTCVYEGCKKYLVQTKEDMEILALRKNIFFFAFRFLIAMFFNGNHPKERR